MRRLVIDFETRSECDLPEEGLMRYAKHASTNLLMLGWGYEDEEDAQLWLPGYPLPPWMSCNSEWDDVQLYAFNGEFELALWNEVGVRKYGFPYLPVSKLTCLAALANRYGLPNTMADVAEALGAEHKKNPEGKALITQFCTPAMGWKKDVEKWERFKAYCLDDVRAERDVLRLLPAMELNPTERDTWEFTVEMNTRGVPIDVPAVKEIRAVSQAYRAEQFALLPALTDGQITTINQVARIRKFLAENGVETEDLTASTVAELLEGVLPNSRVMQLLEMRASLGLSSIGKYVRMENMQYRGRIYYNQRYYGAHTGRWTGAGVQLLNLPRATIHDDAAWALVKEGKLSEAEAKEADKIAVEAEIDDYFSSAILARNPIKSARALIRPMIKAPKGKALVVADYRSIEYVVLEWFAGNTEALERFTDGFDPYKDLASAMYGVPYDRVDKAQRQTGKVGVLGSGYGAGAPTIQSYAYNTFGLTIEPYEAQAIVDGYRSAHHQVVTMWYAFHKSALAAVTYPGQEYETYKCKFKMVKDRNGMGWLTVTLPSGRKLFYNNAHISMGKYGPEVSYYTFMQKYKKWMKTYTTPGKITENIVQAASRDILVNGMNHCRREGLTIIWSTYDEIVCEEPEASAAEALKTLDWCMCQKEEWSEGIPLFTEGWTGPRYRKD